MAGASTSFGDEPKNFIFCFFLLIFKYDGFVKIYIREGGVLKWHPCQGHYKKRD
ncbi:hypothetical protein LH47_00567 [Anoxybacillus thermarum]|uniref:Uncharacterized protein n=1 Tax=Anoxybacillus thermarum TaxID=404937 RepID=A0A0D0QB63_9BACL|nr:hypothetical protein LH47_00567 [Anoxybacillus thermarum]